MQINGLSFLEGITFRSSDEGEKLHLMILQDLPVLEVSVRDGSQQLPLQVLAQYL